VTASTTLQHDALPFSGPEGFVTAAVDVVRDALEREAVPVVLATPQQLADVRAAVGGSAREVVGFDMSVDGRNPARLLPALQRFLDDHPDRPLSCVAEPVRCDDPAPVVREVAMHELLLGLPAFHSWNCRLTCAYQADALPADVVAMIEWAHNGSSTDPFAQVERARAESLPPRPTSSDELGVDRTTLSALRGFVAHRAEKAGLDEERVDDLVYAVNEAVTNSICHGEGRARVSFWTEDNSVVCEVRDRGWIRDPLAGRVAPRQDMVKGRGLWLVNQLCDLVQLRSSAAGTTVRLHVDAPH
jgi:anti-sigma regulatory factor (Ser/Thr protein kinase)